MRKLLIASAFNSMTLAQAFVYKDEPARTPPHLARHRTHPQPAGPGRPRAKQASGVPAGQPVSRNGPPAADRADAREYADAQAFTPVLGAPAAGQQTGGQ